MKKTLCVVLMLFCVFYGFGQVVDTAAVVKEVDSLFVECGKLSGKQNYGEALKHLDEAESKLNASFGKMHHLFAKCFFFRARVYRQAGQFKEAEQWITEANLLNEQLWGRQSKVFADGMDFWANLLYDIEQYPKALVVTQEAENIREKLFGRNSPEYAASLHTKAMIYQEIGCFDDAEQNYFEALSIKEKKLGKDNASYLMSLNNLANVYSDINQLEKAEQYHLEAKSIGEKVMGKNSLDYASSLNNLAVVYGLLGQYDKVESHIQECKAIVERNIGKENRYYTRCLFLLAAMYQSTAQYEKAKDCLLEGNGILERGLGKEHSLYAANLHSLALYYQETGQFTEAEALYKEAINIREKVLASSHPDLLWSYSNLANIYLSLKQYNKAEQLHLKTKKLRRDALGIQHQDYAFSVACLAGVYWESGQIEKAIPLFIENASLEQRRISMTTRYLSERELFAYQELFKVRINQVASLNYSAGANFSEIVGACFDNYLIHKGFLQNAVERVRQFADLDASTSATHKKFTSLQRRLASEYAKPIAGRDSVQLMTLEETANTLEKELTRSVAGFAESSRQITWQEVQAALQPGEAALEFIHFNYYTPAPTDSMLYAALLLKPGMNQPLFIPIFEEKQLKALLPAGGDKLNMDQVNELYGNNALHDLVWSPVEPHLQDVRTVYYSPGGLLHRLNLAALPAGEQSTLADRYDIVTLGSTRQLVVDRQPDARFSSTALVYGGIQFEIDSKSNTIPTGTTTGNRGSLDFSAVDSTLRSLPVYEAGWDYLKWSEKEADNIKSVLTKAGYAAEVRKGGLASEESFKKIGQDEPSPRILHVSTHGYFFPDPAPPSPHEGGRTHSSPLSEGLGGAVFKISDHPMIRSGLILAGANHAWKTGKPLGYREDGVLTAYEISQLDLRNTELVVLSACETGLGQIEGNEGVYGLQRAFKIAGAKHLIMSLWNVRDQQTQELMTHFYQKLLIEKMPVRQALRAARAEMRRQRYEPYYWAGFVVVE